MSFEGHEQCICANGHYFETDIYYSGGTDGGSLCDHCGAKAAVSVTADETNGTLESDSEYYPGQVEYDDLKASFLIKDEVEETCNLGHVHLISPAVFRIPSQEEIDKLRHWEKEEEIPIVLQVRNKS